MTKLVRAITILFYVTLGALLVMVIWLSLQSVKDVTSYFQELKSP